MTNERFSEAFLQNSLAGAMHRKRGGGGIFWRAAVAAVCVAWLPPVVATASTGDYLVRKTPGRAAGNDVVYTGTHYIAVRDGGQVTTSEDGIAWTKARTPGIRTDLNAVAYNYDGLKAVDAVTHFPDAVNAVAAGDDGQVAVSRDGGRSWSQRQLGWEGGMFPLEADLKAVVRAGDDWIAGGENGWIWRSNDGDNWGRAWPMWGSSMGGDNDPTWNSMAVGTGDRVVAVGDANTIGLSTNWGMYWSVSKSGLPETPDFQSVIYDGNRFVAVASSGHLITSGDGQTWEGAVAPELEGAASIAFGEDRYVVVTRSNGAFTSTDLEQWAVEDAVAAGNGIAFGGDSFVVVGPRGVFHQSPPLFRSRAGGRHDNPGALFDEGQPLASLISLPRYSVNTVSLDLILEGTLFRMITNGPPIAGHFVFNAAKNSDRPAGMFGRGWGFAYESSITLSGSTATLRRGSGAEEVFRDAVGTATPGSPVALISPQGNFDKLLWHGNYWHLEEKETKWTYRFDQPDPSHPARLTSITDRNGNRIVITVDQITGAISSIRDGPDISGTRHISFTNIGGHCHAITLPDGRRIEFTYIAGQLVALRDMQGYLASYQYDPDGYLRAIQHPNGGAHNIYFQYVPRAADGGKVLRYVTVGQFKSTYEFVEKTYGTVRHRSSKGEITMFESRDGRTTRVVDPLNGLRFAVYEGRLPVRITEPSGATSKSEYDSRGNTVRTIDPLGNTTTIVYDANDNITSWTNALGRKWNYEYDANDNLTRVLSPTGAVTRVEYDGFGRPQSLTDARGKMTALQHDNRGNLIRITDPLGQISQFHYDFHGMRLLGMTDARGNLKTVSLDQNERLAGLQYDSVAPASAVGHAFDPYWLVSRTDEINRTTSYERNIRGMVTRRTNPLGHTVQVEYDAADRPLERVDELGRGTRMQYDMAGRLTQTRQPDNGIIGRRYDSDGNLTELSGPGRNQTTVYRYDAAGRLISMNHPDRASVAHNRDALGRITRTTVLDGDNVHFTYDGEGRLASLRHNDDSPALFTYDATGNLLTAQSAQGDVLSHTYDDAGRVIQISDSATDRTVTFAHDPSGNVVRTTYSDGTIINFTYDLLNHLPLPPNTAATSAVRLPNRTNRVTSATWNSGRWAAFAHDAASRVIAAGFHNGATSNYAYDDGDRMQSVMHSLAGTPFSEITLEYDAGGKVIRLEDDHPVDAPLPVNAVSNYDNANKLVRRNGARVKHDAAGNLVDSGDGRLTAEYDAENRAVKIAVGGVETTYTYDAKGRRSSKTVNGITTRYCYDLEGKLLFEDTNGHLLNYLYANGRLFAIGSLATGYQMLQTDHRGSVVAATSDAGDIIETIAYSPHGLQATESGAPRIGPSFVGAYGVLHDGGGIYHMRNRHYDAVLGRFLQRDPIGFAGGINLYAYAGGDPLSRIDPLGMKSSALYRWTVGWVDPREYSYRWTVGWVDPREYHPVTRTVVVAAAVTAITWNPVAGGAAAAKYAGTAGFVWGVGEGVYGLKKTLDKGMETGREATKLRTEAGEAQTHDEATEAGEKARAAIPGMLQDLGDTTGEALTDVH